MTEEQKERFGLLIDGIDNLASALTLPLSPQIHVEALRSTLPEKVEELKTLFKEITNENPWE
jgi:hypothetical protein